MSCSFIWRWLFRPERSACLSGLVPNFVLWKDWFGYLALGLLLLVAVAVIRRCSLLLLLLTAGFLL